MMRCDRSIETVTVRWCRRLAGTVTLLGVLGLSGGCPARSFLPTAPQLPASLEWLVEHQEEFWFAETDEPPASADASATALAEQLSGCWAMARPAGGEVPVPLWSVCEFDSQHGTFVEWILQDPFGLGLFRIVTRVNGTYEVLEGEDGPIVRFTTTELWASDPQTGQLERETLFEGPEVGDSDATLDDGSLYLKVEDDPPTWWRYRHMDCLDCRSVNWRCADGWSRSIIFGRTGCPLIAAGWRIRFALQRLICP